MANLKKGLVQVYTGSGKGKTTAAIGLAMRAASHGFRVTFCQFLKSTHDKKAILQIPNVRYLHFGTDKKAGWLTIKNCTDNNPHYIKLKKIISRGWKQIYVEIENCDLLIFDELNVALYFKLITINEVIKLLDNKPRNVEVIITGRRAPKKIIASADLVTEMKEIKHPFQKGIKARQGIEF